MVELLTGSDPCLLSVQLVHADTERALQQRLEEVCSELKASQQEAAAVSGQCFC